MEHLFINKQSHKTIVVLHGMGSNKEDMLDLYERLAPDHNALLFDGEDFSTGMRRYFKRSATGLDLEDLVRVAKQLSLTIQECAQLYQFDVNQVDGFGFSNGANQLLGMVLSHSFAFKKVLALRPSRVDLDPQKNSQTQVRIHGGEVDPYLDATQARHLFSLFDIKLLQTHMYPGGHGVTLGDIKDGKAFLK